MPSLMGRKFVQREKVNPYTQFFDQNHQVLTYNKRILWTKTIIAWLDRWLKGQPEWWFNLYANR